MSEKLSKIQLQIGTPDNVEKIQWAKDVILNLERLSRVLRRI